jgi:CelD/BcsL family acetyltransferase involved in cellulose biosynthesis
MILPEQGEVMFVGAAVSDELDVIAEPELAETAGQIFLNHIRNERHRWDRCEFAPLPECSPFRRGATVVDVMPVVDLSQPPPANMRRNLRRYRRRAERIGRLEFECASENNFRELFNAMIDVHCARWNRRNEPGVLCEDATRRFHMQAGHALFRRGTARVYALRIDGRIVAAVYALLSRGQMRSYIGGFDPDLSKFSLGTLAIGQVMEQGKSEGAQTFNFLRGGERYKHLWGAKDQYAYSRTLIAADC